MIQRKTVFSNIDDLIEYLNQGLKKTKEIESFIKGNKILSQIWENGSFITGSPELYEDLFKIMLPSNYDHFYIKPFDNGKFQIELFNINDELLYYFFTEEQSKEFEKYKKDFIDRDIQIGSFKFQVRFPFIDNRFNFHYLEIVNKEENFNLLKEYYTIFKTIIDTFGDKYKFNIFNLNFKGHGKKSFWRTLKEKVDNEVYDIQFNLSRLFPNTIIEFNIGLDNNNIKVSKLNKELYDHIRSIFKVDYILVQRDHNGKVYYTIELDHNETVRQFFHNRDVNGINFVDGHRIPLVMEYNKDLEILERLYNEFNDEFILVINENSFILKL